MTDDLRNRAKYFREALHKDNPDVRRAKEELAGQYTSDIKQKLPKCKEGLPKFLDNYITQVVYLQFTIGI